ncbi:MAG: ATP-dependent DNA helicase PcrA [Candidatus Abyssobacteria bacterium SURF_5]|uniref:DNA 3'-5' helicase n=1 Tax=Abyssobacteria bacterium (strain SURF_5) TaxID=2093360 RepID=A0A3A4NVV9_ABYX5|nr:MAG: ATP-dependent DNA helicase PcrA [Candidatus Abyssubacteria bacterium SURF_5]
MNELMKNLNERQREAVATTDGPLVVIAGAGSGKTRVITYRAAYLIHTHKVFPKNILAVTFTNKAAEEMRNRIRKLLGTAQLQAWVGTFHATCLQLLRRDAHLLGYKRSFIIYDESDQLSLVKHLMKRLNLAQKDYNPNAILARIGLAKNQMIGPEEFETTAVTMFEEKVAQLYRLYDEALKEHNAMDFDDLLNNALTLLLRFPDCANKYRNLFRYIMVDEFQDTNRVQYELVRELAKHHRNLCVVGDDDQSIYSWRGANIENLFDFQKDFPEAKSIFLEENYRSTQRILDAANAVIMNNERRKPKRLWTRKGEGEKIVWFPAPDEHGEAYYIATEIINLKREKPHLKNSDFAVFYRTNAQSRVIEDVFRQSGLPYVVIGSVRFYDRKEIKDVLAFAKVIANPADAVSLRRIINIPPRGIGKATVEKADAFAVEKGITLLQAIERSSEIPGLRTDAVAKLSAFAQYMARLMEKKTQMSTPDFIREIIESSGYLKMLEQDRSFEAQARVENLAELISAAVEFLHSGKPALEEFIENTSLRTDIDEWDDETDFIPLMTLHSAKGLEFPVVFIAGMEEELFPHLNSMTSQARLEEERRLCYVGLTRAQERIFLTSADLRHIHGMALMHLPSRFIDEIPEEILLSPPKEPPKYYSPEFAQVADEPDASPFIVGDLIEHATFGTGRIAAVSGRGESMKVAVRFFRDNKQRDLMVRYANLKKK